MSKEQKEVREQVMWVLERRLLLEVETANAKGLGQKCDLSVQGSEYSRSVVRKG